MNPDELFESGPWATMDPATIGMFVQHIEEVEGAATAGQTSDGKWDAYDSLEGGTRTFGMGRKLTTAEDQGNYAETADGTQYPFPLDDEQRFIVDMDTMSTQAEQTISEFDRINGAGAWEQVPSLHQMYLLDYAHTNGPGGLPVTMKMVGAGGYTEEDLKTALDQRYWTDKQGQEQRYENRNEKTMAMFAPANSFDGGLTETPSEQLAKKPAPNPMTLPTAPIPFGPEPVPQAPRPPMASARAPMSSDFPVYIQPRPNEDIMMASETPIDIYPPHKTLPQRPLPPVLRPGPPPTRRNPFYREAQPGVDYEVVP